MAERLFDTNKLFDRLRKLRPDSTPSHAEELAKGLIQAYEAKAIVSPVVIEVLAGVRDPHELLLTERFLEFFTVIDMGKILPEDWEEAKRLAKRVVKDNREYPKRRSQRRREKNPPTKPRKLGDCLIVAIAKRLHHEIISDDKDINLLIGRG